MTEPAEVILVHGLWYRAWSMRLLRDRLAQRGFSVRSFSYPTRTRSLEDNARALAEFAQAGQAGERHFVAHSLGGLVTLEMLARAAALAAGRVVLLGVPLRGSQVAARVAGWPGGQWFLGQAAAALQAGSDGATPGCETGMIAGVKAVGLGRLSGGLQRPHDGTVTVAETESELLTDRIELPVTHTGMLVSDQVAVQAAHFLRTGSFRRPRLL